MHGILNRKHEVKIKIRVRPTLCQCLHNVLVKLRFLPILPTFIQQTVFTADVLTSGKDKLK